MVLDASDYRIPSPGQSWNPTNVRSFIGKALGALFVLTFLLYLFRFSRNRGVPLMDSIMARVGLASSPDGGQVEVF